MDRRIFMHDFDGQPIVRGHDDNYGRRSDLEFEKGSSMRRNVFDQEIQNRFRKDTHERDANFADDRQVLQYDHHRWNDPETKGDGERRRTDFMESDHGRVPRRELDDFNDRGSLRSNPGDTRRQKRDFDEMSEGRRSRTHTDSMSEAWRSNRNFDDVSVGRRSRSHVDDFSEGRQDIAHDVTSDGKRFRSDERRDHSDEFGEAGRRSRRGDFKEKTPLVRGDADRNTREYKSGKSGSLKDDPKANIRQRERDSEKEMTNDYAEMERTLERWKVDKPTNCILITNIPANTQDIDVRSLFLHFHSKVANIRIVCRKYKDSKTGYAIVEFNLLLDAEFWMKQMMGRAVVLDQKVDLFYSKPSSQQWKGKSAVSATSWRRWVTVQPSNNIVLWNIPFKTSIKDLKEVFSHSGWNIYNCKIMFDKKSGNSLEYGYVEFHDVATCEEWLEKTKGVFVLFDQTVLASYSLGSSRPKIYGDWICFLCGVNNFRQRDRCFECNNLKKDCLKEETPPAPPVVGEVTSVDDIEGSDEVGTNPCNTILFRGLDALTTEESLNQSLQFTTGMWCQNILLVRNPVDNTSKGFAFGEMASIKQAHEFLDFLAKSGPLEVEGKLILVSFSKNTYSTVMATQLVTHVPNQAVMGMMKASSPYVKTTEPEVPAPKPVVVKEPTAKKTDSDVPSKPLPAKKGKKKEEVHSTKKTETEGASKVLVKEKEASSDQQITKDVNLEGTDEVLEDINLTAFKNYLYDQERNLYYSPKDMKCPVPDCRKKKLMSWKDLHLHWLRQHLRHRKSYCCPVKNCPKKDAYFAGAHTLFVHLRSHSTYNDTEYEGLRTKASTKAVPAKSYLPPGKLKLPMPPRCPSPEVKIPDAKCPVDKCPHSYSSIEKMKQHWEHYHQKTTRYRCDICDAIKRTRKLMAAHMQEKHNKEQPDVEAVYLESKQFIDPGKSVPFWSLYQDPTTEEDEEGHRAKVDAAFSIGKLAPVGVHPEDLQLFIQWTDDFMDRLARAGSDAIADLQKVARRMAEKT